MGPWGRVEWGRGQAETGAEKNVELYKKWKKRKGILTLGLILIIKISVKLYLLLLIFSDIVCSAIYRMY